MRPMHMTSALALVMALEGKEQYSPLTGRLERLAGEHSEVGELISRLAPLFVYSCLDEESVASYRFLLLPQM